MSNIFKQNYSIKKSDRNLSNGHNSFIVWFTGLSGSGKSTIANGVENTLFQKGLHVFTLDGDNVRLGLNAGLGFSKEDRKENLRRIAEVSKLMIESGTIILGAFVSPLIEDRELVKDIVGDENFIEVYVKTSLEECERRDVKGLYVKARKGEIKNFTGISAPYELPLTPDLVLDTEKLTIKKAVEEVICFLENKLSVKNE